MNKPTNEENRRLSLCAFDQELLKPLIPLYEVGVERAQIAYWRREGLLPFIEKGKWAKVSIAQAIWIMMLDSLRSFGVSTEVMQKLAHYFIQRAYEEDLPKKNLEERKKALERNKLATNISPEEEKQLKNINTVLKDEVLLYSLKGDINYFSNLISHSITTASEVAILIFSNGQIVEQSTSGHQTISEKEVDISAPHITVSLNYFLRVFIQKEEMEGFLTLAGLFSEDEERVLREMRSKNVQELNIKLQGGEVVRIESTKAGQITGEQAQKIREILGMKNYQSITLDTRDEKTLSFKLTSKRKT